MEVAQRLRAAAAPAQPKWFTPEFAAKCKSATAANAVWWQFNDTYWQEKKQKFANTTFVDIFKCDEQ